MIYNGNQTYANLSFAIMLLGIFSIFEISKGNQKYSLIKYYILARLIIIITGSGMDYFGLSGNEIPFYREVFKTIAQYVTVNLLFLIILKKIPKLVIGIEIMMLLLFVIEIIFGLEVPTIKNGILLNKPTLFHLLFYVVYALFGICSFFYLSYLIFVAKKTNTNLYDSKIKKWAGYYVIAYLLLIIIGISLLKAFSNGDLVAYNYYSITAFLHRFLFLVFILYRPKFLDDDRYSIPFNQILAAHKGVNHKNFDFLFYYSHYYLNQDASMEDFALKLNVSKNELSDFLKHEIDESFTELLNKNRILYIKELLKAKKYESFTIEALSELSGFNNKRTMYYAFTKYNQMTPTEYIESIK